MILFNLYKLQINSVDDLIVHLNLLLTAIILKSVNVPKDCIEKKYFN